MCLICTIGGLTATVSMTMGSSYMPTDTDMAILSRIYDITQYKASSCDFVRELDHRTMQVANDTFLPERNRYLGAMTSQMLLADPVSRACIMPPDVTGSE